MLGSDPNGQTLSASIVQAPVHGSAEVVQGMLLRYIPNVDYVGPDAFSYQLSNGSETSAPATVSVSVSLWTPPIGIPSANFGIDESHTMYRGQTYNFSSGAQIYPESDSGPYTHYVDNTHPNATDSNNPYGTPQRPRNTPPRTLTPGSVVEIRGGPYDYHPGPSGEFLFEGNGEAHRPIFVRGPSTGARPRFESELLIGYYNLNNYIIVENLDLFGLTISHPRDAADSTHHVSVRNCRFHGDLNGGGCAIGGTAEKPTHDIVFYSNIVTENGNWQNEGDRDIHGLGIGSGTYRIFVVDNEFSYNEGDGVQVNSDPSAFAHHIYLGRNTSHHNKQTGLWTKYARDVIFSQNTVFGHRPSSSASGAGMGFQYGPESVWFVFNHIFDNELGISNGSPSGPGFDGDGVNSYYIGNLIHDIHHSSANWNPSGTPDCIGGSAICLRAGPVRNIINNTIYDVDAGISGLSGATTVTNVVNNIIANISEISYSHHLRIDDRSGGDGIARSHIDRNLFFQAGDPNRIRIVADMNYDGGVTLSSFRSLFPGKCVNCWDSDDPGFVDSNGGNFHLLPASLSRARAEDNEVYQTFLDTYGLELRVDFENFPRPQSTLWALGAFE